MHLLIYGPEGSGKGTQAQLLSKLLGLSVITSGDLVREAAKAGKTKLAIACQSALDAGIYVDDKTMFSLWKNKLEQNEAKKGFILDGFPRNIHQANFLFDQIKKNGYGIDKVIYIKLSDEEAVKRLIKRKRMLYTGSKETHDTPERIHNRLQEYHKQEKPLIDFFRSKKILVEVDGNHDINTVYQSIRTGLGING